MPDPVRAPDKTNGSWKARCKGEPLHRCCSCRHLELCSLIPFLVLPQVMFCQMIKCATIIKGAQWSIKFGIWQKKSKIKQVCWRQFLRGVNIMFYIRNLMKGVQYMYHVSQTSMPVEPFSWRILQHYNSQEHCNKCFLVTVMKLILRSENGCWRMWRTGP